MADKPKAFERPPHATEHCRHYSYEHGANWMDGGPRCAVGVDLSEPGSFRKCMPGQAGECSQRAEYTHGEREAWRLAREAGTARLIAAIAALPAPIPFRTSGTVECPNCEGRLAYSRWHRGAGIACETPGCCEARFNIAAGADWPSKKDSANV